MMRFRILGLLVALTICPKVWAQTATVTWTTTYQTMDGWGGEDWISAEHLTSSQADMFFSPTLGIGLQYIRTGNYACPNTGACTVSTSNVPDLVSIQEAVARGANVELSIQSPPADLKCTATFSSGTLCSGAGGTNPNACIETTNYSAYATFMVQWVQLLQSNNAWTSTSVLDVANEADTTGTQSSGLGACAWSAAGFDTFIGSYLGPALQAAGLLSSVRVMMPSNAHWFGSAPDTYSTCLEDATCTQYVSIVSAHGYGTGSVDGFGTGYCCAAATAAPSSAVGKTIWQSEVNGGAIYDSTAGMWIYDPSMSPDAIKWARSINDYMAVTSASGYQYWELADCCNQGYNDGLTDYSFSPAKRFYVVGQWSKYIRSGWIRIDATANPTSGVYVTAFKDPSSGNFAIVAINQNTSAVTENFSLSGFPSVSSVTPTVTSESANLADQTDVTVSGTVFSYSLPTTSVVTFHGASSSAASKTNPAPPTALTLTIQ
ncbi:MAG: hypothetical protein WBR26_00390 [Candidatus Acidiferrum sp.]